MEIYIEDALLENFLFDYSGKKLMKLNGQIDYDFSHNGFFALKDLRPP